MVKKLEYTKLIIENFPSHFFILIISPLSKIICIISPLHNLPDTSLHVHIDSPIFI